MSAVAPRCGGFADANGWTAAGTRSFVLVGKDGMLLRDKDWTGASVFSDAA
jgi:hypothetical protein